MRATRFTDARRWSDEIDTSTLERGSKKMALTLERGSEKLTFLDQ